MPKSARTVLTSKSQLTKITDAYDAGKGLVVLFYILSRKRFADMFNVTPEMKKAVLRARASDKWSVSAALIADDSDDLDGHPSVVAVEVTPKKK